MAKRTIIIQRPEGLIPGLRQVNDMLRKLGWVLVIAVDTEDAQLLEAQVTPEGSRLVGTTALWKDCYLLPYNENTPPKWDPPEVTTWQPIAQVKVYPGKHYTLSVLTGIMRVMAPSGEQLCTLVGIGGIGSFSCSTFIVPQHVDEVRVEKFGEILNPRLELGSVPLAFDQEGNIVWKSDE